jgi:phosphohistidine phosphatase
MDLYVIRHAEALALGQAGVADDAERPLSDAGRSGCRRLAEALLRRDVRPGRVVSSPLVRARQTAEELLAAWPDPKPGLVVCPHLAPGGKRGKLTKFLRQLGDESLAVVGHEPDLSLYLARLIRGKKARVRMAKAGVAHLTFDQGLSKKGGVLDWLVTPEWY